MTDCPDNVNDLASQEPIAGSLSRPGHKLALWLLIAIVAAVLVPALALQMPVLRGDGIADTMPRLFAVAKNG